MATAGRTSALVTLQNNVSTAANGVAMDITSAEELKVEISGTYTNVTCNFECSVDAGVSWQAISLSQVSATTPTRLSAAVANGVYHLENALGYNRFRARITVGAATGGMTVKAITSLW